MSILGFCWWQSLFFVCWSSSSRSREQGSEKMDARSFTWEVLLLIWQIFWRLKFEYAPEGHLLYPVKLPSGSCVAYCNYGKEETERAHQPPYTPTQPPPRRCLGSGSSTGKGYEARLCFSPAHHQACDIQGSEAPWNHIISNSVLTVSINRFVCLSGVNLERTPFPCAL